MINRIILENGDIFCTGYPARLDRLQATLERIQIAH